MTSTSWQAVADTLRARRPPADSIARAFWEASVLGVMEDLAGEHAGFDADEFLRAAGVERPD